MIPASADRVGQASCLPGRAKRGPGAKAAPSGAAGQARRLPYVSNGPTHCRPGRADLPVGLDARQRVPAGFGLSLACLLWGDVFRGRIVAVLIVAFALVAAALPGLAADLGSDFDAANKLYEQGKFPEAAAAYEKLVQAGAPADAIHFNLGNAWFKAGQTGRAIAEWRRAEQSSPRDPSVRFNLQFARKRVTGSDAPAGPLWQRALSSLTLNEWTVLTSALLWVWFLLLGLREFKPGLRKVLSGYTATAGLGALLLAGCLVGAATLQFNTRPAVVIVNDAIARTGPLDEAKVLHQLRDGTEVIVLDEKEVTVGEKKQTWLQVRDSARRTGWVKGDQLSVLGAAS